MRRLLPGDLDMAVRVLLARPESLWPAVARRLLGQAHAADGYRLRSGRAHPRHGTGSLASAASGHARAALPGHCDRRYLRALAVVAAEAARYPCMHSRQRGSVGSASSRFGASSSPQSRQ